MSDLPDEVMDRAVEAAMHRIDALLAVGKVPNLVDDLIRAAAPVLIEAERERIKARTEAARVAFELAYNGIPSHAQALDRAIKAAVAALSVIDEEVKKEKRNYG